MNNAVSTALAAIAVTALLWPAPAAAAAPGRGPTGVIVERVGLQRIADSLEALGTLRANETVDITANVSDTISRVNFEDGQAVEAGDVLVELTDREESALLAEAESLAEEAQRQYERIERLVAQGNASESLLDERRREWRTADARLDAVSSRLADRYAAPGSPTGSSRRRSAATSACGWSAPAPWCPPATSSPPWWTIPG